MPLNARRLGGVLGLAGLSALAACMSKKPVDDSRVADAGGGNGPSAAKPWFEAELEGLLTGAGEEDRRVVLVAIEPCTPERVESLKTVATAFLAPWLPDGYFQTEAAARDGSTFYVCAFAIDAADRMVGFGQYARPLVVRRGDRPEVELQDLDIDLSPVTPRQLPVGRYGRAASVKPR